MVHLVDVRLDYQFSGVKIDGDQIALALGKSGSQATSVVGHYVFSGQALPDFIKCFRGMLLRPAIN